MSPNEPVPHMREFAATKTIAGFDVVGFNPSDDNRGEQIARLVRRVTLQLLTGIAMKQRGLDPGHIHPRVGGEP